MNITLRQLRIFDAVARHLSFTRASEELHLTQPAVSMQIKQLEQEVGVHLFEEMKGLQRGHLGITVASTANYFVPKLWATFRKRHPGVSVSLDVTNREGLIRALATIETDLVIMGQPPEDIDLVAQIFMPNPLVVIAPPTRFARRGTSRCSG